MTLNDLAQRLRTNAVNKGFWENDRNFGEMLALIHSEVSEALEEHRPEKPAIYINANGKPEGWQVELVDALIRILDTLGPDVDIDGLIAMKMSYNESRPYKHGKAY